MKLFLNDKLGEIDLEMDDAMPGTKVLVLAHGAGAGIYHPFMVDLAARFANEGINVIRFNFPYMSQGKKLPRSSKDDIETWQLVLSYVKQQMPNHEIYMGGKSYGGRMGSRYLALNHYNNVKGIIYFGFPLHAPGKDSKDRASHLSLIESPQLFIQGAKDKLANPELMLEVMGELKNAEMQIIEHADHSFKVPKSTGTSADDMIRNLAVRSVQWIRSK